MHATDPRRREWLRSQAISLGANSRPVSDERKAWLRRRALELAADEPATSPKRRQGFRERYGTFAQVFLSSGISLLVLGGVLMFLDRGLALVFLIGGSLLTLAVIGAIYIINSANRDEERRRRL